MKNKPKYNGGILLIMLSMLSLFSCVLILIIEDYENTHVFSTTTINYYKAKIMTSMFLIDVKENKLTLEKEGRQKFSEGTVSYKCEEEVIIFSVNVHNQQYVFQEDVSMTK